MTPQFPESVRTALVSINIVIGIASLLSNSLIIHGVRVNTHMHTTTNYFIVNMAVGDILASLVSVSYTVYFSYNGAVWSSGTLGRITCKSVFFIQLASMYCSIYSLFAMTFDRFMAVLRPLRHKYSSHWTRYILPLVWLACLATPVQPVFNKFDLKSLNGTTYCLPAMDSTDDELVIFCFGYCIPHVVMVIMYSVIAYKLCTRKVPGDAKNAENAFHQTAKKVTIMIVCTLIAFNLTWGPHFIYSLIFFFSFPSTESVSPLTAYITSLLTICNGPFNALIYAFCNAQFRAAFRTALGCNH